nr:hypothetical protein [Bacillus thuringiensis]
MVSIVIELFNGFIVVPLAGPGMVKLTFVLTTAEKPIPTSEVIVPNTGRIPKPVAPVGPVIPIPVGPVPPVGPVIPIPVKPVAPVGPVIPVGPVGNVNGGIDGSVGPIKFGSRAVPCKILYSSLI